MCGVQCRTDDSPCFAGLYLRIFLVLGRLFSSFSSSLCFDVLICSNYHIANMNGQDRNDYAVTGWCETLVE